MDSLGDKTLLDELCPCGHSSRICSLVPLPVFFFLSVWLKT